MKEIAIIKTTEIKYNGDRDEFYSVVSGDKCLTDFSTENIDGIKSPTYHLHDDGFIRRHRLRNCGFETQDEAQEAIDIFISQQEEKHDQSIMDIHKEEVHKQELPDYF